MQRTNANTNVCRSVLGRFSSFDSSLWSDLRIAGLPVGMKRYLLALIPAVIVIQVWFDWTTHHNTYLTSLATYKPVVDVICAATLISLIVLLLGLASFERARVAE